MRTELERFDHVLRDASTAEQVPRRVRIAIKAIALFRERHGIRSLGSQDRRLLAMMPAIFSGRIDPDAVLDVARRILTDDE